MQYFPPSNQFEGSSFFKIFSSTNSLFYVRFLRNIFIFFVYYDLGAFTTFFQVQTKFPSLIIPILQKYGPYFECTFIMIVWFAGQNDD